MATSAGTKAPAVPTRPGGSDYSSYAFPATLTEAQVKAVKQEIESGAVKTDDVHKAPEVPAAMVPDFVKDRLPADAITIGTKYRTKILGVDYSAVATALLTLLTASRKAGNYSTLFKDLNLAIATAYTVSRDTSNDYRMLDSASAFREFEISGRTRSDDPATASKNAWVMSSNMNATALRLAGHLAVECAPKGGFLAQIKETKGTPFSPVQGGKELEELMREASKELTDGDHSALKSFSNEFERVLKVLDKIWGQAGASAEAAEKAAAAVAAAGTIL